MNYLDKISYDSGGYTVQEILSSFTKKILEIIDLVNKNEELCDEARTLIENIRNEVVPDLVEDIIKELQDTDYFDNLVNVTLIENLRTELTTLLNQAITDCTTRLDNFGSQLDNITNDITDINLLPQGTLPAKQSISSCSKKLALKVSDDVYKIIQVTNKGYVAHTFKKGNGDTGSSSVGENYDLLRLQLSEQVNECFLWFEPNILTGSVSTSIAPSILNTVESFLVSDSITNSIGNITGLSLYDLAPSSSITFEMITRKNNIANIMYLSNTNRSDNVEISINDVVIKTINSNKGYNGGYYNCEEFNVPSHVNGSYSFTVKIENKGVNKFSFVGLNFSTLKDFDGKEVNSFKAYKKDKVFINAVGASDYAIRDKELNKWCGSYHGGEIAEQQKITWNLTNKHGDDYWNKETHLTNIPVGRFTVVDDMRIIQKTNINDKATMTSIFDFNVDGTINMNFGLTNNTIKATDIYTALTCTSPNFIFITYPNIIGINENDNTTLQIQNGYIEQYSRDYDMKLGIRYNIFNNEYNTKGHYITHNINYAKFYYGPVSGYDNGIVIPNLTFSKALDFYNILL